MRQQTLSPVDDKSTLYPDIPEADYEELRKLLLPYDPKISIERAIGIGRFLLRIHELMNKGDIDNQENKVGGGNE